MRRFVYAVPAALLLAVAALVGVRLGHDPSLVPSALIDRPAPEFALPPLMDGVPGLARSDLAGRVALLNVFASWCIPCKAEHPLLMGLAKRDKVPIYAIAYKDKPEDSRAWLERLGNPYRRIGMDADGRAGIEWGVYGVPETFVIDRAGRVRYRHVGPMMERDVEEVIRPMVKELER